MDELRFWKYHGTGNDFVLLEDVEGGSSSARSSRAGCATAGSGRRRRRDPRRAVFRRRLLHGSPQLRRQPGADVWQRDPLPGQARLRPGLVDRTEIRVDTRSGVKTLALHVEDGAVDSVTVGMGPARFAAGRAADGRRPGRAVRGRAVRGRRAQLQGDRAVDGQPAPGPVRRGGSRTTSTSIGSARWSNATIASPSARTSSSSPSRATA
jgi:Diaminopimelate epimerase